MGKKSNLALSAVIKLHISSPPERKTKKTKNKKRGLKRRPTQKCQKLQFLVWPLEVGSKSKSILTSKNDFDLYGKFPPFITTVWSFNFLYNSPLKSY